MVRNGQNGLSEVQQDEYFQVNALQLVETADGSTTIFDTIIGEHYHSRHGALQESRHVFLNEGLLHFLNDQDKSDLAILEVGLGAGLNFLLSADFCLTHGINLNYVGIEPFPLPSSFVCQTGYVHYISDELWYSFIEKYELSVNNVMSINKFCQLQIAHCYLLAFQSEQRFDIIYFDAFSAIHQPDMWSFESIEHACRFLKPGGLFVTYAITGHLKRSLKKMGFSIEKVPGPPGKREMLRATKN